MHKPNLLIQSARQEAGLTQAELARRLGTSQSAVARLETPGSNPSWKTLERTLDACGKELHVFARPRRSGIDETLVAKQLRATPEQRLRSFQRTYADVRELALAGRQSRGELA